MTRTILSSDDRAALKTATRRLIRAAGGVESAATVSRVQKSALSDYQNPALQDHFIPIDVVVELERDTGTDHVTQALCRMSGGYFTHIRRPITMESFPTRMSRVGKEIADVFERAGAVMAEKQPAEESRRFLVCQIEEAIGALAALKESVQS